MLQETMYLPNYVLMKMTMGKYKKFILIWQYNSKECIGFNYMLYLFSGDYNLGFRGISTGVHISRLQMGSMREKQKSYRKAKEMRSV